MRASLLARTMVVAASMLSISAAFAQQSARPQGSRLDLGKIEYEANCASCHGLKAKGDGPTKPFLTQIVPDLSTLAKRNNGILPVSTMYDVIVGDKDVGSHGSRDMPVWGREYKIQAGERLMEAQYDPEAYIRARVLAVIEYINRLQEK